MGVVCWFAPPTRCNLIKMAGGRRGVHLSEDTIRRFGSNRSIVRMIGTRLPIDSTHRLYVQLPGSQLASPMISGGGGVFDDEGPLALLRDPPAGLPSLTKRFSRLESIDEEESNDPQEKLARDKAEASQRLTSLETELARLKSQIALYSLMEQQADAPPPPPPPPPPPLPDSATVEDTQEEEVSVNETETKTGTHHVDIGHEIGSVKLRKLDIKRSPGGTPFRPHQPTLREPTMDDPAAVIAHALRKKFSHRIFQDSPDKENVETSFTDSPGPSMRLFD